MCVLVVATGATSVTCLIKWHQQTDQTLILKAVKGIARYLLSDVAAPPQERTGVQRQSRSWWWRRPVSWSACDQVVDHGDEGVTTDMPHAKDTWWTERRMWDSSEMVGLVSQSASSVLYVVIHKEEIQLCVWVCLHLVQMLFDAIGLLSSQHIPELLKRSWTHEQGPRSSRCWWFICQLTDKCFSLFGQTSSARAPPLLSLSLQAIIEPCLYQLFTILSFWEPWTV